MRATVTTAMVKTITLNNRELKLKVRAFTTILYEEEFKGHSFYKDYYALLKSDNRTKDVARFLWALAREAGEDVENFEEFSNNFAESSLGEALTAIETVINMIDDSMSEGYGASKNPIAAASH